MKTEKKYNGKIKILFITFICLFNFVFGNGKNSGGSGLQNRRKQLRNGEAQGLQRSFATANTPFGQRALPASYATQTPQKYKVLKPIPNVEEGQIIPWFNQPGLGIQYKLEKSVQYYIDEGYLQIIP